MPNADLPRRRQRDQLVADEEQKLDAHLEVEGSDDVGLAAVLADAPKLDFRSVADRDHPQRRLVRRRQIHFRVDRDPFDDLIDERRGEDELPSRRVLHTVADEEVRIGDRQPVVVGFDDLHAQWIHPLLVLLQLPEHQPQVVLHELV